MNILFSGSGIIKTNKITTLYIFKYFTFLQYILMTIVKYFKMKYFRFQTFIYIYIYYGSKFSYWWNVKKKLINK